MAGVVGVACCDCTSAIELFGQDEAGEFVGHGDGAKRECEMSAGFGGGGPAAVRADGEDEVLVALIATLGKPGGEVFRGELAAAGIEEDEEGRGAGELLALLVQPEEEGGFVREGLRLDGLVGLDAVQVEAGEGVEGGLFAGFCGFGADVGEGELHPGSVAASRRAGSVEVREVVEREVSMR